MRGCCRCCCSRRDGPTTTTTTPTTVEKGERLKERRTRARFARRGHFILTSRGDKTHERTDGRRNVDAAAFYKALSSSWKGNSALEAACPFSPGYPVSYREYQVADNINRSFLTRRCPRISLAYLKSDITRLNETRARARASKVLLTRLFWA